MSQTWQTAEKILKILARFLPFILFWTAVFTMRRFPLCSLWAQSFINAETAVRFWVNQDYSYLTAFGVGIFCGNLDLVFWFFLFIKGRQILEQDFPRAGKKFVEFYQSLHQNRNGFFGDRLAGWLITVFEKHHRTGLTVMGAIPFLDIIVGVPTAVGYGIKNGYFFMAVGNSLKIIILGYFISKNIPLAILCLLVAVWIVAERFKFLSKLLAARKQSPTGS